VPQENVELVMRIFTVAGVDLVREFGDDEGWAARAEALAPYLHEDFECRTSRFGGASYKGLDGLRTAWLEWLAPWASYRAERHDPVDLGDSVLVPSYNYGRLHGSTEEVRMDGAAVFTVRDKKIARVELYTDRAEALKAVGLEE
jgi:ketosteroid isomerase-like protein